MPANKSTFGAPASATSGLQGYDLDGAGKKVSKKTAAYTDGPVDKEPCRDCTMFRAPDSCTAVRGTISPDGHCKYFDAISKAKESAMDELKLFIPITKIDAVRRLVYGVVTAESPDVAGEVCDYASTKPHYEKWSAGFAKATDGKSLGNLRAMHGNVAAGKVTEIAFNDDARNIEICAKVVDDGEWAKVEEGVYTGFSQGGKYVKRWPDPADSKLTRYTAEPIEVSLVDNPCLPEATFSVVKADGTTELRKFKPAVAAAKPSMADIAVKAVALALAAGDDRKWADFVAQATTELTKSAAPAAVVINPGETIVPAAVAAIEAAADRGEQVWINKGLPGRFFPTEAEMQEALVAAAAAETVKKEAAPVVAALTALRDKFTKGGEMPAAATPATAPADPLLGKKKFSDEKRKQLAADGKARPDGSYPIEDAKDVADAVKDWNRSGGSAADKRHIVRNAKKVPGGTDELPPDWPGSTKKDDSKKVAGDDVLRKDASLWSVADFLTFIAALSGAEERAEMPSFGWEQSVELPKDVCDRFGAAVVELLDIATEMLDAIVASKSKEEMAEAVAAAARAADLQKLAKVGAKHSRADKQHIKQAHDHLAALDPDCCPGNDDADADKVAKTLAAERNEFKKQLDGIMAIVTAIAAQPMPMGTSSVRVVEKTDDTRFAANADMLDAPGALEALADVAIRKAHAQPMRAVPGFRPQT